MKYFLTIAASDNSGGAGIQQDIKVAHDLGYWVLSSITGITSQDFKTVIEVQAVNSNMLKLQIEQCLSSFDVQAIKIGAICSKENIEVIAECLRKYKCKNVVLDTVLASTSGRSFLESSSLDLLKDKLFPLTSIITPNKTELEILTNCKFTNIEEAVEVAKEYCNTWNTSILIKGGHFNDEKIKEAIVNTSDVFRFERERNVFRYSHGTGCTLSSALACYMGIGNNPNIIDSYNKASEFLIKHYIALQNKFLNDL